MRILLIVYDNESYVHWFPQNIAYIASSIRNAGYEVVIYNQDIHHYTEDHLTNYLDNNKFDLIGVGVTAGYYQYNKIIKISEAINRSKNRPFYILGGHGPAPEPEFYIKKTEANAIVIGEGEITIVNLIKALENKTSLSQVKGIAYKKGSDVILNERQPLIKDIDSIPIPAYDLFPIMYYRLVRFAHTTPKDFVMPMLSGRGCRFNCSFCYRMDEGFRARNNDNIIEEVTLLQKDYGINYIYFNDELLMDSEKRVISLCESFIKAKMKFKWACMGRLNFAKPPVLKLMKAAGCVFINYGIEAMDNTVLKKMNKALTTNIIKKGIEATLKSGISPGYNIIFGNLGDNKESLQKGVDFLLEYDDGAQLRTIRPVTPYPGCPLYEHAIKTGLLSGIDDFYSNKHLNSDLLTVNFTELNDNDFYKELMEANLKLVSNYYDNKKKLALNQVIDLYENRNENFRGFRQT